eukprot:1022717_1
MALEFPPRSVMIHNQNGPLYQSRTVLSSLLLEGGLDHKYYKLILGTQRFVGAIYMGLAHRGRQNTMFGLQYSQYSKHQYTQPYHLDPAIVHIHQSDTIDCPIQ